MIFSGFTLGGPAINAATTAATGGLKLGTTATPTGNLLHLAIITYYLLVKPLHCTIIYDELGN